MKKAWIVTMGLAALSLSSPSAQEADMVFRGQPPEFEDYGYLLSSTVWPSAEGEAPIIFVCWENPGPSTEREQSWVRDAVEATWQNHSAIEFRGWEQCAKHNAGIHIRIADEGPHVKMLGRQLDDRADGMVLNFAFQKWGAFCQGRRESCIRAIAIHEFGHAIGFAHEHNRPDTPGECMAEAQGPSGDVMLTPYDPASVMNYCHDMYQDGGRLSARDIESVQAVYGAP